MENNNRSFLNRCADFLLFRGKTEESTKKQRKLLSSVVYFASASGFAQGLVAISDNKTMNAFGYLTTQPLIILFLTTLSSIINVLFLGYFVKLAVEAVSDYEARKEQMENDRPILNKIATYMNELKTLEDNNVEIFTRRKKEEEVIKTVFGLIDTLEVKSLHEPLKDIIKKRYPQTSKKILEDK